MTNCIDHRYGDLLYAYELGMLSEDERKAFEQHLIECEFCSSRAAKNLEVAAIIRHDSEIHDYTASLADDAVADKVSDSRATPARKRIWRRWSYSIPAAAALLLVLLLVDWQIDIRPANEVIAGENRLVILPFENVTDPADPNHLSHIATNLLVTDLGESKHLRVISSGYMLDLAAARGTDAEEIKRPQTALELAREARATWILSGELLSMDSGLVISSQLAEVATGNILSTQRVSGSPQASVFALIDSLSAEIRRDFPLPNLARDESDLSLSDITTHSAEAYRHYLNGVELATRFYLTESIAEFKRALEYDSTFAMVYYYLARYYSQDLIEAARKYGQNAGPKEKKYIESWYRLINEDTVGAVAILEGLVADYPDEPTAFLDLGFIHRITRKGRESVRYYEAALRVDPFNRTALNALAYAYDNEGDREKAILTVNRYIEIAPDEANPYDTRGDLFLHHNEIDAALESYLQALRIKPDNFGSLQTCAQLYLLKHDFFRADSCYQILSLEGDSIWRAFRRESLAYVPLLQGQFSQSLNLLDSLIMIDTEERTFDAAARKLFIKARVLSELGRRNEAIDAIESTRRFEGPVSEETTLSYLSELALTLVDAGRIGDAQAVMELIRGEPKADSLLPWEYRFLKAYIDFHEGMIKESVKALGKIDPGSPHFPVRYWLARAYLADSQFSRASEAFETIWGEYSSERFYYGIWFVKVHYYLGIVYEESRWTDKAIEQYEAFLAWWGNADTALTEITDARVRLARLRAES